MRFSHLSAIAVVACVTLAVRSLMAQDAQKTPPEQPPAVAEVAEVSPQMVNEWLGAGKYAQTLTIVEQWGMKPPAGLAERSRLLMLGKCLLGLKRLEEAVDCLQKMREAAPDLVDDAAVEACVLLGEAYSQLGRTKEAAQMWQEAARLKPLARLQNLTQSKTATYFHNRVSLDMIEQEQMAAFGRIASMHKAKGDKLGQAEANMRRLNVAVDFPGMRQLAVETGRLLLECGKPREATTMFLRALDTGLDRCFTGKARLAENQRQLDLVAQPPSETLVHEALEGINQCLAAMAPQDALPSESMARYCTAWHKALSATYRPETGSGDLFMELAKAGYPPVWRALCLVQAAQACLREGDFRQCKKLVLLAASAPWIVPREQLDCLFAFATMGEGKFKESAVLLQKTASASNPLLASFIQLALAECHEGTFDFQNAAKCYRALAESTPVIRHKAEAEYALKRLEILSAMQTVAEGQQRLFVLPDDRSTRGDWARSYGLESYLLAAHEFKRDTSGGLAPGKRLKCRFSTTIDTEKSRLWVTRKSVEDAAALWNPRRATRMAANRDDYGEQHPIGTGPDLLMSCEVPEGGHTLALYFVNDYNYYESNRAYTVTATDDDGKLLCSVPVRHFGGGLYKRFAVEGPLKIQFRIWRNTAINVIFSGVFLDAPSLPPVPAVLAAAKGSHLDSYNTLREAAMSAKAADLPALMDKCNALLDTLQNDPSVETSMASLWMQSRLAAFAGRSREGARLLAQAADTASSSETLYALIMDSFQGRERQQRTLSWLPPGCHELDILWQSYFKKLEGDPAHSTPALLLKLAQSSDWRVTSYAMGEAWRLLEKQRKMPPGVQLATRLCLEGKNVGEGHDEIAFTALNALEADARKAGDKAVLRRVGNQLLTLTGRYKMEPERLIALCGLFEEVNAHENVRGTATLRVAKAYERKRDFEKARLWLDKVPPRVLSPQGRQTLLDRWKALEEVLEKRKNASNTTK